MKKNLLFAILVLISICSRAQVLQVTSQQLFNAFKQNNVIFQGTIRKLLRSGGNCASVAFIKSAIGTFGVNGVFKNVAVDPTNKIVHIILRDDTNVDLTFDRMNTGKKYFSIQKIGEDEVSIQIADYARFCFAVMCRQEQLKLGYDKDHFYKGMDRLNQGFPAGEIYSLLGVKKKNITDLSINNLRTYNNLVVFNGPHAVYSSLGSYDEFFTGTQTGIEPLSRLNHFHCRTETGCPLLGAYTLE